MDNIISNHEQSFIEDTTKTGRFILSIGSKGSGKSYLLCSYLKYVLKNKVFDKNEFKEIKVVSTNLLANGLN